MKDATNDGGGSYFIWSQTFGEKLNWKLKKVKTQLLKIKIFYTLQFESEYFSIYLLHNVSFIFNNLLKKNQI